MYFDCYFYHEKNRRYIITCLTVTPLILTMFSDRDLMKNYSGSLFMVFILYLTPYFWTRHTELSHIHMPGSSYRPSCTKVPWSELEISNIASSETLHCQSSQRQEQVKNMLSAPGISPYRGNWMLANRGQRSLAWRWIQGFNHWTVEGRGPSLKEDSKTSPMKQKISWNSSLISKKLTLIKA